MSRSGKEFGAAEIEYAFRKSGGCCEQCGSKERLEVDHILAIWYAEQYFPQLASWVLKSAQNAQVLCHSCHTEKHRHEDFNAYNQQASILVKMMGDYLV